MRRTRWIWAGVGLALLPFQANADKWSAPEIRSVESENGAFRFTIRPREFGGTGELWARDGRMIWVRDLPNRESPVSALVADDGRHVVTFAEWAQLGHGPHVVVCYGERGELLYQLRLTQIASYSEWIRLHRSVSSIRWGGWHRIEGNELVLQLAIAPWDVFASDRPYLHWGAEGAPWTKRRLDLHSGVVKDRGQPHPVDVLPAHSCPADLEVRDQLYFDQTRRRIVVDLFCAKRGVVGPEPRDGAHWLPTSSGWVLLE